MLLLSLISIILARSTLNNKRHEVSNSRKLRQMRLLLGEQIIRQPPRDGRIAHAAVGQHADEGKTTVAQRMRGDPAHRAGTVVADCGFEPEHALANEWCDLDNSSHGHLTCQGSQPSASVTMQERAR